MMSVNNYELSGDSGEYEFLKEAVELSKDVEGMCVEIGVRRGLGTKTIIDAVRQFCPNKAVIAIDCYGSIPYTGREHVGKIRLDYDNTMKNDCMANLWAYVRDNPVNFYPCIMTDDVFFGCYNFGFELYDIDVIRCNKYSMVHLDAEHTVADVARQILWFNERMDSGAVICVDDVTIDFFDIKPIQKLFTELGWVEIKMGFKKGLWAKK